MIKSNMKNLCLILVIIFLNVSPILAQFRSGYIIENNNDTIYGSIKFEGSIINSGQCKFMTLSDSTAHVYHPGEIKAFRFNEGKYFISREIQVNDKMQMVFLEWLIKGKASILTYSPMRSRRYFLLTESDSLYELLNTTKNIEEGRSTYIVQKHEYIVTLKIQFKDCPSISKDIEGLALTSNSLIKITKEYNDKTCPGEKCLLFEDKNRKVKLQAGLSLSNIYSQLNLNNGTDEKVSLSKSMGVGLDINVTNLPLLSPKFSLSSQIMYYGILYRYESPFFSWMDEKRLYHINYLRIPFQLNYKLLYKKFTPFISAGFTTDIRFGYKQFDKYLVDFITLNYYKYNSIKPITKYFQTGLNAGFGIQYQLSDKATVKMKFDYEHGFRFYGTLVSDFSSNNNYFIQTTFLFKLK
jgi:hypothetical protein